MLRSQHPMMRTKMKCPECSKDHKSKFARSLEDCYQIAHSSYTFLAIIGTDTPELRVEKARWELMKEYLKSKGWD